MSDNPVFLYAGEYDSVDDARADLETLKELHREHVVGTYDAAVGLIFPPGILVGGLLGAGTGALIGHLEGGMSREDIREVGEMLDNSEAALIVVGEATIERAVDDATKQAKRELKKEIRADAREMEKAVDEA